MQASYFQELLLLNIIGGPAHPPLPVHSMDISHCHKGNCSKQQQPAACAKHGDLALLMEYFAKVERVPAVLLSSRGGSVEVLLLLLLLWMCQERRQKHSHKTHLYYNKLCFSRC